MVVGWGGFPQGFKLNRGTNGTVSLLDNGFKLNRGTKGTVSLLDNGLDLRRASGTGTVYQHREGEWRGRLPPSLAKKLGCSRNFGAFESKQQAIEELDKFIAEWS